MSAGTATGIVLLTGVTGFVGRRLLNELLEQSNAVIVCLVRARDTLSAQRRGKAITENRRVVFVAADLEAPRMGLCSDTWERLSRQIEAIYHCAASVSFDLPLEESRRINESGTRRLLALAQSAQANGQFKRFHHVSTAYVAGYEPRRVDATFLPADASKNFRNTYERSKAAAERMLRQQSDVAVSLYRPSIICGDTRTGFTDNFNVLYTPMRMIYRGALPFLLKSGAGRLDCVGVDYVARAIVALSKHSTQRIESFHLTAGDHFTVDDLARVAVGYTLFEKPESGVRCKTVNRVLWQGARWGATVGARLPRSLRAARRWGKLAARGFEHFEPYEPYCGVDTTFTCERERELLAQAGLSHPRPIDYLHTITRYAIESRFGARPISIDHDDTGAQPAAALQAASA